MAKHTLSFFLILLLTSLIACSSSSQNTTGKILDNANDAIKSDTNEIWWLPPEDKQDAAESDPDARLPKDTK